MESDVVCAHSWQAKIMFFKLQLLHVAAAPSRMRIMEEVLCRRCRGSLIQFQFVLYHNISSPCSHLPSTFPPPPRDPRRRNQPELIKSSRRCSEADRGRASERPPVSAPSSYLDDLRFALRLSEVKDSYEAETRPLAVML